MAEYIKHDLFLRLVAEFGADIGAITSYIRKEINPKCTTKDIKRRLFRYRQKGYLPIDSGNKVSIGEVLKGTSTLYDDQNQVVMQWVKSDVDKTQQLEAIQEVISDLAKTITPLEPVEVPTTTTDALCTLYLSNDIHFGALMWAPESGENWDMAIAQSTVESAYDYLFDSTPRSKIGVVADLGDLMEVDSFKNVTPQSGNPLAVDGRYPKILRAAYGALVYAIQKALLKHEQVVFINIAGNHDMTTGHAIREIVRAFFANEPRVIVDDSPSAIKYLHLNEVLLQFAHGDGLKMKDAGEVMAHDCQGIFSETKFRYAHFGHTHKDAVYDGRLCRAESHRNLAPLNDWAAHKGFRRQLGTMKAITYHSTKGEVARSLFTLT